MILGQLRMGARQAKNAPLRGFNPRKWHLFLSKGRLFSAKTGNTWVRSAFGNVFTILLQN